MVVLQHIRELLYSFTWSLTLQLYFAASAERATVKITTAATVALTMKKAEFEICNPSNQETVRTLNHTHYQRDRDVFGDEEDHDVRISLA